MGNAVFNANNSVAYLSGIKAAVKLPKSTKPIVAAGVGSLGDISPWGADNLFPQNVIEGYRQSTIVPKTLEKQSQILLSSGIVYGKVTGFDKNGKEEMEYAVDPEVELWMKRTNIKRYLRESSLSFHWFYNLFPELIKSADGKQIVSIVNQRPEYCRYGKQNQSTGLLDKCYISADWSSVNIGDRKLVTPVDVIDTTYDPYYQVKENAAYKMIYPVSYPSPGCTFYQLAPHDTMRSSGWLDVQLSIPQFKKALFKNQITVKYLIEVSTWWWNWQYPGFDSKNAEEKKTIMDNELTNFEAFLTGSENAGKSIMTTYQSDPQYSKVYDGWKITAIDNKLKDGIYIEDSQEAASHLLYALGFDPTLIGPLPGRNGMGAGSGSDKRVAFNIYLSMVEPYRDVILEPLQFAFDYNWPDRNYKIKFMNSMITTLDQGTETKQAAS
jgi:hypothetical protein